MDQTSEPLPVTFPTVVHALVDAAAKSPEREALALGEERLNYREYLRCVAGFSRDLRDLGLGGCRVALLMGNSIDVCIAMYAVHAARAEAVPLNPVYTVRELLPMLDDAGVSAIVFDQSLEEVVLNLADALHIEHLLAVGSGNRLTAWRSPRRSRLAGRAAGTRRPGHPAVYRRHHRQGQGRPYQPSFTVRQPEPARSNISHQG